MTDHWLSLPKFAPGKVIWVPESCKCFFLKSGIGHIFACISRNPGRNLQLKESGKSRQRLESEIHSSMRIQYQYLESEIYSVESRIPTKLSKLSWITLHVVTNQRVSFILLTDSKRVRYNWNSCINCFMRYVVKFKIHHLSYRCSFTYQQRGAPRRWHVTLHWIFGLIIMVLVVYC